jgi:predicted TIM-barrel fold metal-dependent hydrolase
VIVDVHTHFLPAALASALRARDVAPRITGDQILYGEGSGHLLLPSMEDLDLRFADMERQGIDFAVLGANVPGVDWLAGPDAVALARDMNDELVAVAAAHPDRLAAMAALPMQEPEAAAAELERAVGAGAVGAMVYSNVVGRGLDDPAFEPVFAAAARLGAPLYLHPAYPVVAGTMDAYALIPTLGFLVDTTSVVLRLVLGGLYERHPELDLVLGHAGSLLPQLAGRIDVEAKRMPGGMGVLSAPPSESLARLYTDAICAWPPALHAALAFLGPDRVMFGTDYPFWDPAATLETVDGAGLAPDVLERVQSGNAQRLFDLSLSAAEPPR